MSREVEFHLPCESPSFRSRSNATWKLCGGRSWFSEGKNKPTRQSWPSTEELRGRRVNLLREYWRRSKHWPLKGQVIVCISSEPEVSSTNLRLLIQQEVCTLPCLCRIFNLPAFELIKFLNPLPLKFNNYIFKNMLTNLRFWLKQYMAKLLLNFHSITLTAYFLGAISCGMKQ